MVDRPRLTQAGGARAAGAPARKLFPLVDKVNDEPSAELGSG
jgi:hypothetical protein